MLFGKEIIDAFIKSEGIDVERTDALYETVIKAVDTSLESSPTRNTTLELAYSHMVLGETYTSLSKKYNISVTAVRSRVVKLRFYVLRYVNMYIRSMEQCNDDAGIYSKHVSTLNLGIRSHNSLCRAQLDTVPKLCAKICSHGRGNWHHSLRNIGMNSMLEIEAALRIHFPNLKLEDFKVSEQLKRNFEDTLSFPITVCKLSSLSVFKLHMVGITKVGDLLEAYYAYTSNRTIPGQLSNIGYGTINEVRDCYDELIKCERVLEYLDDLPQYRL